MCRIFLGAWLLGIVCNWFNVVEAAVPCGSPASVSVLSLDLPTLPELDKHSWAIILDDPAFFIRPIRCHLFKNIRTSRYAQPQSIISLDTNAKKYITAALQDVFCDSNRLGELLAYLQDQGGLFAALAAPLVAVLVHFFDQYAELIASYDCVSAAMQLLPSTAFTLLKHGMLYEFEKYPRHHELISLLGIKASPALQVPDHSNMRAPFAQEDAGFAVDVVSALPMRVVNKERAYAFFKETIAELPWNSTKFKAHWAVYWAQEGLDICTHHEFLIRALCEMWLKRRNVQREPCLARQNKCLKRLCEALNHEAQNLTIDRHKRVFLSTESLMRYVDYYLCRHWHKENFKTFLRMSTYSQDYIQPL